MSVRRSHSNQIAVNSSNWIGISVVLSRENDICGISSASVAVAPSAHDRMLQQAVRQQVERQQREAAEERDRQRT